MAKLALVVLLLLVATMEGLSRDPPTVSTAPISPAAVVARPAAPFLPSASILKCPSLLDPPIRADKARRPARLRGGSLRSASGLHGSGSPHNHRAVAAAYTGGGPKARS